MLVYLLRHVITWTRFQLTQILVHLSTELVTVINVKFALEQAIKAQRGAEVYLYSFFNLGTTWGGWSTPLPRRFTPGLNGCGKSRSHRVSISGTSSP
jgi:hypothetical protein